MIFISHKLHEVMAVADRVTVLRGGRSVATVATADATARARRADGRPRRRARRRVERAGRRARTRCSTSRADASAATAARTAVRDVSLPSASGEIVGIAGVAGNGQRELAEAITGMRPRPAGVVPSAARRCGSGDPRAAIDAGVAHVPEDRLGTGVAPSLSIAENAVLKSYRGRAVSHGPLLRWRPIRERAPRADRALRRRDAGPATRGARPVGRQPAEARPRARVLGRAEGADRRLADARPRRRRDRDRHAYLREAAARRRRAFC